MGDASMGIAGVAVRPGASRAATASVASSPAIGAHVWQRPSGSFQQAPQVYWRQFRQKLNARWNASSWCDVAFSSSTLRASAIASENDESSDITKLRMPRENTLTRPMRDLRGAPDSKV